MLSLSGACEWILNNPTPEGFLRHYYYTYVHKSTLFFFKQTLYESCFESIPQCALQSYSFVLFINMEMCGLIYHNFAPKCLMITLPAVHKKCPFNFCFFLNNRGFKKQNLVKVKNNMTIHPVLIHLKTSSYFSHFHISSLLFSPLPKNWIKIDTIHSNNIVLNWKFFDEFTGKLSQHDWIICSIMGKNKSAKLNCDISLGKL